MAAFQCVCQTDPRFRRPGYLTQVDDLAYLTGTLDLRWITPKSSTPIGNLADGDDAHWSDHMEGDVLRFGRT